VRKPKLTFYAQATNLAQSESILTDRLLITPFREKHLGQRYLNWLNDPVVIRYSKQRHISHTIESCRGYLKSFDNSSNFFWAIEEKAIGLGHIGNINAYLDTINNIADLGIVIGEKKAQAQGYGLEAWLGVCNFLFIKKHIRKITAGTMELNQPMIRLMLKAGMEEDGRRRRHYLFEKMEVDIIHMAFFRKDINSY